MICVEFVVLPSLIFDVSTYLRWEHQVIQQHCDVVALINVFAHPPSLRRRQRGIRPEGIKISAIGRAHSPPAGIPTVLVSTLKLRSSE